MKLLDLKKNIELLDGIDIKFRKAILLVINIVFIWGFGTIYSLLPVLSIVLFSLVLLYAVIFINMWFSLASFVFSVTYMFMFLYATESDYSHFAAVFLPSLIPIFLMVIFAQRINILTKNYVKEISRRNMIADELEAKHKELQIYSDRLKSEIEEKFRTERILIKSEEQFRNLAEKSRIAILMDNKDGDLIYFNKRLSELNGYSFAELEGMNFRDYVHTDDYVFIYENHKNRMHDGIYLNRYEFRMVKKDKKMIYVEAIVSTVKEKGLVVGSRAYLMDISSRKLAELALKESEQRFRGIYNNSALGFYRMDTNGRVLMANPRFLSMLKINSAKDIIKKSLDEVVETDADRYIFFDLLSKNYKIDGFECEWYRTDGGLFYGRETAWTIFDEAGEKLFIDCILEDVTERKQVEEEREKLIYLFQTAQSELKVLSGLLPICSACKKIRDDSGNWANIEQYIDDHSEAEFSHGICPDCAAKIYPGYS